MTHWATHWFNILPNVPFGLSKGSGNLMLLDSGASRNPEK
jgi:hypothetical protein